jgi:hypothetical protein
MALRNQALARNPADCASTPDADRSVTFVKDGEEHRVDIGAPRSIRRGRRRLVQLIDLWVASLLPGEFLDLRFSLVTSDDAGVVRRSPPLEALRFARGYVTRRDHKLFWEGAADSALNGLRLESIEVAPALAPVLRIVPATAPPVRPAPLKLDLRRLLPHAHSYPQVQWVFRSGDPSPSGP